MKHNNYKTEFVEHMPEELEEGILYVAPHFECALHKCMCGCGEFVCTALVKGPGWTWNFDGANVSLSPSIGNYSYACKSHYFLKNGKVQWCQAMLRLVSADDVKEIICKYENRTIQRTMVFEIEKLNCCIATEEQMLEILGNKDINFED